MPKVASSTGNGMLPAQVDIFIAGAGYVGLAVAVAIKNARPSLSVALADAAPPDVWRKDVRASAIIAAAIRMLKHLGVWDEIEPEAEPIRDMVVTDSRTNDPVRPVFLTFAGEVEPGEPFAHMIPNVAMNAALRRRCADLGVTVVDGIAATGFSTADGPAEVSLSDGRSIRARLVVAADGVKSKLRDMAGIKHVRFEYEQSGIVCTVEHERPHEGRAEEHFLPAGPFAILPLKGNRSSIVWNEGRAEADRLVAADPLVFEAELERRFGLKLGEIRVVGKPRAFPFGLTLVREFVAPRFALAGDAAHGIHPISGQGLNLGFKDVAALAETIVEADRMGEDIGALDVLRRYERWRRFDTVRMGITTDVLNRMFSNDFTPMRVLRDIGLGLVDRLNPLKRYFIREASGLAGPTPRLLRGEAI